VQFERERCVQLGTERFNLTLDSGDESLLLRFEDDKSEAYHVASLW
jgi:hypothetical protein